MWTPKISLVVTHLETSIYRGDLLESGWIQGFYATNSLQDYSFHDAVHLYDSQTHNLVTEEKEKVPNE